MNYSNWFKEIVDGVLQEHIDSSPFLSLRYEEHHNYRINGGLQERTLQRLKLKDFPVENSFSTPIRKAIKRQAISALVSILSERQNYLEPYIPVIKGKFAEKVRDFKSSDLELLRALPSDIFIDGVQLWPYLRGTFGASGIIFMVAKLRYKLGDETIEHSFVDNKAQENTPNSISNIWRSYSYGYRRAIDNSIDSGNRISNKDYLSIVLSKVNFNFQQGKIEDLAVAMLQAIESYRDKLKNAAYFQLNASTATDNNRHSQAAMLTLVIWGDKNGEPVDPIEVGNWYYADNAQLQECLYVPPREDILINGAKFGQWQCAFPVESYSVPKVTLI